MLELEHASAPAPSVPNALAGAPADRQAEAATAQPLSVFARAAKEFVTTPAPVLLASFLVNLLALALPFTLLQIYDRILPNAAISTLVSLLIGLFTVVIADIALRILRDHLMTHSAIEKAFRGRVLAIAKLLHTDLALIRGRPGRYWLDRMTAVEELASVKENADKGLFIDLPFVVIFLSMVGLIGGWLVAVPFVLSGLVAVVIFKITGRQRQLAEARREADEKRYARIAEWLGGISTIKLLAMETQIYRRFEAMLTQGVANSYLAVLQNNRLPMAGQLFSSLMMVMVSTAGAIRVIEGSMSIGSLACCSLLATRVAQPVFRVIATAAQMRGFALVEERVGAIHDLPVLSSPVPAGPIRGHIELIDVSVPPSPGWGGFSDLGLIVEPGEVIGIASPIGSGKTELLSLLDGTRTPSHGRVLIDGRDASSPEIQAQKRAIQRIDGRVAIFRGTILENVTMFRTGLHIAEAVAAVEAIGLDAQINKLPEGYDTPIGDGAPTVLPYGIQQALMIARALAQQPAILIVSQIGALLEIDNYRRLERALRLSPARPTAIMTSQRGSVFSAVDKVYGIRDGRLHPLGALTAGSAGPGQVFRPGMLEKGNNELKQA
jgi:ABC-type bacteriocin/lantibiotic exporter with double-glycine peptidase domain